MNAYTVKGTYGRGTPCEVHCFSTWGGTWYAVDGSVNVNMCRAVVLSDGVDVETLKDDDTFTAADPIKSAEQLRNLC